MSFLSPAEDLTKYPLPKEGIGKKTDPYHRAFGIIAAELITQAGRILRENIETSAEAVQTRCRGIDQSIRWKMTHGGSSNVHRLRAVESPAEHGLKLRREAVKQTVGVILDDLEDPESDLALRLSRITGYAEVRSAVLTRINELVRNPERLMTEKLLWQVKPDKSGMMMDLGGMHARSMDRFMTNR